MLCGTEQGRVRQPVLEQLDGPPLVSEPTPASFDAACCREAQLADLRELVGSEHDERLRPGTRDLIAERRLAPFVPPDAPVLADRAHDRGDV